MDINKALDLADQENLDLVLMNDSVNPPICKLLDYGKLKYEREKKAKANRAAKQAELKEIKMGCQIMPRDIEIKAKNIRRIIQEGDKVKIIIKFRGREMIYIQNGTNILQKCIDLVSDIAIPVGDIKTENNAVYVVLRPR